MDKVYLSSASFQSNNIEDIITRARNLGIQNIELTGGLTYSDDLLDQLVFLKSEYTVNFLLHNYFPPPKEPFVFNLSSSTEIGEISLEHAKKAIDWSEKLGGSKIAFHAGFLLDIPIHQIGKKITKTNLIERESGILNFTMRVQELNQFASDRGVEVYIENNVLSSENYQSFGSNPFLFTDYQGWLELELSNKPLLDLGHLFVSSNSLGFDFIREAQLICNLTDYIHISDNDGLSDSNNGIRKNGDIFNFLKCSSFSNKTVTLEIYESLERVKDSLELLKTILS